MKKVKQHKNTIVLLFSILLGLQAQSSAQGCDWENPSVKTTNALPYRQTIFSYANQGVAFDMNEKLSSRVKTLDGIWQFYWLKRPFDIPADFLNKNLNYPNKIKVPSNWVAEGYGEMVDTNLQYPWGQNTYPNIGEENPVGMYKTYFSIPDDWEDHKIRLYFKRVSSAMNLWINGKKVGYHQGNHQAIEFDITRYLQKEKNSLIVQVFRWCEDSYFEKKEDWNSSGILDEVLLLAEPKTSIADFQVKNFVDTQQNIDLTVIVKIEIDSLQKEYSKWSLTAKLFNKASIIEEQVIPLENLPTVFSQDAQHLKVDTLHFKINKAASKIDYNPSAYKIIFLLKDKGRNRWQTPLVEAKATRIELNEIKLENYP